MGVWGLMGNTHDCDHHIPQVGFLAPPKPRAAVLVGRSKAEPTQCQSRLKQPAAMWPRADGGT